MPCGICSTRGSGAPAVEYRGFCAQRHPADTSSALPTPGPGTVFALTLGLMRRNVDFDSVPGFNRLAGLMTMLAVAFAIAQGPYHAGSGNLSGGNAHG